MSELPYVLMHGDCLERLHNFLPADSVDAVITDPPYEAEAHTKGRRCRGKVLPNGMRELVPAAIDFDPMDAETRARLVAWRCSAVNSRISSRRVACMAATALILT